MVDGLCFNEHNLITAREIERAGEMGRGSAKKRSLVTNVFFHHSSYTRDQIWRVKQYKNFFFFRTSAIKRGNGSERVLIGRLYFALCLAYYK